jgi:hypothetical protein
MTAAPMWEPEPHHIYAYDLLVDRHGWKITYKDMYLDMAPVFGWPPLKTRGQLGNAWYQKLPLAEVGTMNGLRNEPCLAALVRWQDRLHIGKGYQTGHFNCHGVRPTAPGHEYDCGCWEDLGQGFGPCHRLVHKAAWAETRLIRAYPYRHWA